MPDWTWEQAVQWLREQPDQKELVDDCYYDDPLLASAQRFTDSEEWIATAALLPKTKGRALDLGAGRGIASFALAQDGWQVTALEPDPSALVGSGAIRQLAQEANLSIDVIEEFGETIPLGDQTFDLVYGRQVLHHAQDLPQLCREVARILKPGGCFVATREHVISQREDLQKFLDNHALHKYYGGENAYLLDEYVGAIERGGLHLTACFGPFDNPINYFPMTYAEWRTLCARPISKRLGSTIAALLTSDQHPPGRWLTMQLAHRLTRKSKSPGRLYSFVAHKS